MTLEILRKGSPHAPKALIALHGRGGSGPDILPLAERLCDDQFYILAPTAPTNTWYPESFMAPEEANEPYLSHSIKAIQNLIDETAKSIPHPHIYLMGFSQGASLALEVSTRKATLYGGIIAFTGALIGPTLKESKYHGNFNGTKVFISNGDHDPYIPLTRSQETKQFIENHGANVTLKIYPGRSHSIIPDEIAWVKSNIF